ncbi:LysR family transcriptional regulator [Phytomonospora sp. NPDC050363]|uniref:LysR family transcriptional regulator n=1 Tax=Phytomonospora sp. NPDC050363 TaxID=3155642 RepID=UPI0033D7ADDF
MDVHLRDLRYFAAVADDLNFTAAAARLYVSQPALSKQIRRLEEQLRTPLFDRSGGRVALTAAGSALLPHVRDLTDGWERARTAVATAAKSLTVGFHTRVARGVLPALTASMREALPGWTLRFRQFPWSDATAGLATGEADVAVVWLPLPEDGRFTWSVVSTEDRLVALPAGHRLAGRAELRLAELADEPFVALPASAGGGRDFWLASAQRDGPALIGAEAETAEECLELVAAGLGVALISAGNAGIYARGDLAYVRVTGIPPGRLAVVWRAGDERRPVRVVADACAGCLCRPGGSTADG